MTKIKKYYEQRTTDKTQYEKLLKKLSNKTTSREFFSTIDGQLEPKRKKIHDNIVEEYLSAYKTQSVPRLYFILGSIGSGKTSLKDTVIKKQEIKNFLYINFDDLKLKLPEYSILKTLNSKKAAHFVQSESAKLAGLLYKRAIQKKVNIIYEKNLRVSKDNKLHIVEEIKKAFKKQYTVSIHIVFLDSLKTAWERVQLRYEKIRRYVPKKEVLNTFQNLFPNLNKLLNIQFKTKIPIKIWIWYNGPLEIESAKTAHLIGLIGFNGPKEALYQLYDQLNITDMMISDKKVDYFAVFIHYRLDCLPKQAKKNLLQMDCLTKLLKKPDKKSGVKSRF